MRKLYRNKDNALFLGVLAGLADYFKVDPNVLRVIFIFAIFITGGIPGSIAYFAALVFMPQKGTIIHEHGKKI